VVLTLSDVNAALRAMGEDEVYGDVLGGEVDGKYRRGVT
jgi:hypothetical protein